jgi:hypothetical protein
MATPHQTPHKILSPDIAPNITASHAGASATQAVHGVPDASLRTANVSERTSEPTPRPAAPSEISPRRRWAHLLVLDMLKANLPLPALAEHLKIPFLTLIDYIHTPEVQAEIDAYESLINLRARLLGESARPISLRKLLDVLESPAPRLTGRDPDADTRALHRHAELIRRTATTIARESRALAPTPPRASKSSPRTEGLSERTASSDSVGRATGCSPASARNGKVQKDAAPAPTQHTPSDLGAADFSPLGSSSSSSPGPDQPAPSDNSPSATPGRSEPPVRQSPTEALRADAGSTHTLRDPSRRARDRPAA